MKCISCGGQFFKEYLDYIDLKLIRCQECRLIFLDKIPPDEALEDYYREDFYDDKESERFNSFFEKILKLSRYLRVLAITCFCKKTGKMIDVGFSRGTTMKMLEARGWEVFGTQISPIAYKNARKKGLNVFLGEIKYAGIAPKSRDLVTFWHVLEHVKDPGEYIKETNRLLKDSGKLIIEIPNIASPIAKIFGKKWFGLDLPRHIYHFSPESLKHILIDNGFCIVKERYFSLDQSIFSLLQCILNLFNHRNNVLFSSIKKNAKIGFFPAFYNWLLAAIFLVPSLLIAPLMGFLRCGDIMRVYCIKVNDSN